MIYYIIPVYEIKASVIYLKHAQWSSMDFKWIIIKQQIQNEELYMILCM